MGTMTLPKDHRCFDGAFRCAAEVLASHRLTWLHLKAQAIQESLLDPRAVSPAGAKGIMQFMPATGHAYGLKKNEDFFDPEKSIDAGARYMGKILGWFREGRAFKLGKLEPVKDETERWHLALAAYNVGIGNAVKAVRGTIAMKMDADDWPCVAHNLTAVTVGNVRFREPIVYVSRIKKYLALLQTEYAPSPTGAAAAKTA
jgi:membrane-bound lytic murein transglycosylase MltF